MKPEDIIIHYIAAFFALLFSPILVPSLLALRLVQFLTEWTTP